MKLLEIKNNLVKLSYSETENPILGRFIVLATDTISYVAQFVNLKSDTVNSFAIAKLLFTFTPDGVVDNYDGSVPSINSELSFLPASELLNLLPVETAIKIGTLSQQEDLLSLDISMFERNFTVFVEKESNKSVFIANCVRQLFQLKEKSVIIDTSNSFEDYQKIVFTKDFKLPLNSKMIDYIFEYDLAEVDASTKAVIQDIFYAVQQYIKTLDFEFLPIDNFVDVVTNQYKEIQMPELALLKNKLLKYRDANIFANTKEEVLALKDKLNEKNCSIIDIKDINESLQKEVLAFIHSTLESFEKYIYLFVPVTDGNSDKKLLKQFINNNHIFTTFFASHTYKYAAELKQFAQNIILFAPQSATHDFAAYNTFLNKLNPDECIVFGKLTQGIPFITDMSDLDLDLTLEDVLGDKYQFVPVSENLQLVKIDENGNKIPVNTYNEFEEDVSEPLREDEQTSQEPISEEPVLTPAIPEIVQPPIEVVEDDASVPQQQESLPVIEEDSSIVLPDSDVSVENIGNEPAADSIIEPVADIMADDSGENKLSEPDDLELDSLDYNEDLQVSDLQNEDIAEDTFISNEIEQPEQLTEDDLNFIEDNQMAQMEDLLGDEEIISEPENSSAYEETPYINEQPPVVPVYPAEPEPQPADDSGINFQQGDSVTHPRYGRGVIEKIIKYGNKTLCSISFENVGRRLLDPTISELTKL